MPDHVKGLLITTLGVLMILPDSLFIRLIDAAPMTTAFWRALLSGGVTLVILLAFRGRGTFREVIAQGPLVLLYALFTGASGVLFVIAISLTSVANVVFIIAAIPIFGALFSWLVLGERIDRRMALTIAVVVTGLAIIARGSGQTEGASLAGDLLAVVVAASFAAGLTVARRLKAVSMIPVLPLANLGAALVLLPFAAPIEVAPQSWIYLVLHGGVFIVVSNALLSQGPRYLPPAEVGLLMLLESALAPLLVWAVLGEVPGSWTLLGGAVVLGALLVSNVMALRRRKPVPPMMPPEALL
jgi:drug/metabolite transporter (DMT)-like permease